MNPMITSSVLAGNFTKFTVETPEDQLAALLFDQEWCKARWPSDSNECIVIVEVMVPCRRN